MESLKTKQRRVVVPKKKKTKRKVYFGMEVQDAIVRYNDTENAALKNKIYQEEIHKAFDKLCENIINTFKFEYFDDVFMDVKNETVAFLVMNMHKYDHTKGSKAFSYFSVVAKNYLIFHNNTNYKKYKQNVDIKVLNNYDVNPQDTVDKNNSALLENLIDYFERNLPTLFKKKQDIDIAYAVLELLKKREEIENFNKKALYILIREMTDVDTASITSVINIFKRKYVKLHQEFHTKGYISDNNKFGKFFK